MRLRPALAILATTAIAAAISVCAVQTPPAMAADVTAIEAESMAVAPARAGGLVADAGASGGSALALMKNATASVSVSLPTSSSVVVRARGQQCNGAPKMTLAVDGVAKSTIAVSATTWMDFTIPVSVTAGIHTVSIAYTNDAGVFLICDRNLFLDRLTVVGYAPTSTTPTTTPLPGDAVQLGAVTPFSGTDVVNAQRGQYENLLVRLFPQGQPAQSAYPAWPGTSDAGDRFEWKDLQPTAATSFNFAPIDTAIANAAAQGKRFHFRVMAFASCCKSSYPGNTDVSVPAWLRQHPGATSEYVKDGITYVIPNWNNDSYLRAVESLVAALGQRYNKDERLAWFELSGYGDFSENHNAFMRDTLGMPGPSPSNSTSQLGYYSQYGDQYITKASITRIVNATLRAFPDTQILTTTQNPEISKQLLRDSPALTGIRKPVGVRADCLGVYEPPQTWAVNQYSHYVQTGDPIVAVLLERWRTAPVVTEWCTWAPNGVQAYFEKGLTDTVNYHVSMLSSTVPLYQGSTTMPTSAFELWQRANKYGGYRYAMTAANLPTTATAGSALPVTVQWTNFGTAPVYDNWNITYELRDDTGAVRKSATSALSLTSLAANQTYTNTTQPPAHSSIGDTFTLSTAGLPPGRYTLHAKVVWNEHKPGATTAVAFQPMRLAQEGRDTGGAYPIASVSLS